jgi:putative phage-type endonuclease
MNHHIISKNNMNISEYINIFKDYKQFMNILSNSENIYFQSFYETYFPDNEKGINKKEQESKENIHYIDNSGSDDDNNDSSSTQLWISNLSENEIFEVENSVYEMIGDYIQNEIGIMSLPNFHELMKTEITEFLFENLTDSKLCKEDDYDELKELVNTTCESFFEMNLNIPPRSYKSTFTFEPLSQEKHNEMASKLEFLASIDQPKQRSEEWYKFRHGLITASNIWKVFGSQSQKNSLIYEKCKPYNEPSEVQSFNVNVLSPMHWGNKYEPLTIMLYEKLYNTHVSDFGCIRHSQYPFIGASPDGINTDKESTRFGRMVEVKNIFNRDITGIPKEEYWIQMQIQMETCDLDDCDFIETRFKEYESNDDFYKNEPERKYRGVVLYFVEKVIDLSIISNAPHYVFMPLDILLEKEEVDLWIKKTCQELQKTHSLYEAQYWYLDEISVVLVKRNKDWFKCKVDEIESIWKTIEHERVEGYEHRNTRKKPIVLHDENSTSQTIQNLSLQNSICLIKLDENGEPL